MTEDFSHDKLRIVQEIVPGREITLAHIIANPDESLFQTIGMEPDGSHAKSAIGIVTVSPSETAIIIADIALKSSGVSLCAADRIAGTLIIAGTVSQVESAMAALTDYARETLKFSICDITRT